jgi:hypothetical protein
MPGALILALCESPLFLWTPCVHCITHSPARVKKAATHLQPRIPSQAKLSLAVQEVALLAQEM